MKQRNEHHLIKEGLSISDIFFSKVSAIGDVLVSLEQELSTLLTTLLLLGDQFAFACS